MATRDKSGLAPVTTLGEACSLPCCYSEAETSYRHVSSIHSHRVAVRPFIRDVKTHPSYQQGNGCCTSSRPQLRHGRMRLSFQLVLRPASASSVLSISNSRCTGQTLRAKTCGPAAIIIGAGHAALSMILHSRGSAECLPWPLWGSYCLGWLAGQCRPSSSGFHELR